MPVKIKLVKELYLTEINRVEDILNSSDLANKCIMCREPFSNNKTLEHIYPKWLLQKYKLFDQKLNLPNGSQMPYRMLTVNCCEECNGGPMSQWEKLIKESVEKGFNEFVQIDEKIIAWWLYKIYYSKIVLETILKNDVKDANSQKIINDETIKKYNCIFFVMNCLIKDIQFDNVKPYEIYIFKTTDHHDFYYIDDIIAHVIYMQLDDIAIIASLDSYNILNKAYNKEVSVLKSLSTIHSFQALELFIKMCYYRKLIYFDSCASYRIKKTKVFCDVSIKEINIIKEIDERELHNMMKDFFKDYNCSFPEYGPTKRVSFILKD